MGQLSLITKTLQVMENRVEQNENQISRLNLLIHNELERTDPIS